MGSHRTSCHLEKAQIGSWVERGVCAEVPGMNWPGKDRHAELSQVLDIHSERYKAVLERILGPA